MSKTIFILLDACQYDAGSLGLGYLEHLIEHVRGAKYRVKGELPSISRPIYETLLTGVPVYMHGITNNTITRGSIKENVFSLCKGQGLGTAAAAFGWVSELYNKQPFDRFTGRFRFGSEGLIDNGIFYLEDYYPDSHLFMDGDYLINTYAPHFLMVHSMGIDFAGHLEGSDSTLYHNAIAAANELLATYIPRWEAMGYHIVVTADHGMSARGIHGGPSGDQRETPLYIFSDKVRAGDFTSTAISQLNIAPLLCNILEVKPSGEMLKKLEIESSQA